MHAIFRLEIIRQLNNYLDINTNFTSKQTERQVKKNLPDIMSPSVCFVR